MIRKSVQRFSEKIMLNQESRARWRFIPSHRALELHFNIQLLIADPPYVASRLAFDCSPKGKFLGLDVNGKRVSFTENVFYEFRAGKIVQVWSVIDKAAIEAQL